MGAGLSLLFLGAAWWSLYEVLRARAGFAPQATAAVALALGMAVLASAWIAGPLAGWRTGRRQGLIRVGAAFSLVLGALALPWLMPGTGPFTSGISTPGLGLVPAVFCVTVIPMVFTLGTLDGPGGRPGPLAWLLLALWPLLARGVLDPRVSPTIILPACTAGFLAIWPLFRRQSCHAGVENPGEKPDPDSPSSSSTNRLAGTLAFLLAGILGAALACLAPITRQHVSQAGPLGDLEFTVGAVAGLIGWTAGRLTAPRGPALRLLAPLVLAGIGLRLMPRLAFVLARPDGRDPFEALLGPARDVPVLHQAVLVAALMGWLALLGGLAMAWGLPRVTSQTSVIRSRAVRGAGFLIGLGGGGLVMATTDPVALASVLAPAVPATGALGLALAHNARRPARLLATIVMAASLLAGLLAAPPPSMGALARAERGRPFADPAPVWTPEGLLTTERVVHAETDLLAYRLDGTLLLAEPSDPQIEQREVTRARDLPLRPPSSVIFDGYVTPRHLEALAPKTAIHLIRPLLAEPPASLAFPWRHSGAAGDAASQTHVVAGFPPTDRPWQVIIPPLNPSSPLSWSRLSLESLGRLRNAMPEGSLVTLVLDPGQFSPSALLVVIKTFREAFGHTAVHFTQTSFESARLFLTSDPSPAESPWSACSADRLFDGLLAIDAGIDALTSGERTMRAFENVLPSLVYPHLPRDPIARLAPPLKLLHERLSALEGPGGGSIFGEQEAAGLRPRWRATLAIVESLRQRCDIEPYSWFRAYGVPERLEIPLEAVQALLGGLQEHPGDPAVTSILEETLQELADRSEYEKIEKALREAIEPTLPWPGASYFLGKIYLDVLEPELALPHLERAWTLSPLYRDVDVLLGLALMQTGKRGRATDLLREAWQAGRVPPDDLAAVGSAFLSIGERKAGIEALRAAVAENPHDLTAGELLHRAEESPPSEESDREDHLP